MTDRLKGRATPLVPSDVTARDSFRSLDLPPGRSDLADQSSFVKLLYPPRIEKLPMSTDFSVNDFNMTLGAGNGSSVVSANLRFQVPGNQVGWLQQFQYYVLTPTANAAIQFAIRINEGPIPGFTKLIPPGVANFILLEGNELRVRIPQGATVDIIVTNLNAFGPWTVGGMVAGWYHPEADERRIFGVNY